MIQVRKKLELSGGDFGWLKALHHFDVGFPGGNRSHTPIGNLYVLNDDEIAAGKGFPSHRHENVEIITYVREGTITHTDSTDSHGEINSGDVQVMSAGTGITHCESAGVSVPAKVFQIWIKPRENGGSPSWKTKSFPKSEQSEGFTVLASGMPGDDHALYINADARVLRTIMKAGKIVFYQLGAHRKVYLVVADGQIRMNGQTLQSQDGAESWNESEIAINAIVDSEILLVDVA